MNASSSDQLRRRVEDARRKFAADARLDAIRLSRASTLGSIAGLVLLGVAILGFTVLERNPASRAVFVVVGTSFIALAGWLWSIALKIEPAQDRRPA